MNALWTAQAALRRLDYDECIAQCTQLLTDNPLDQAIWLLKCRALTERAYVDDVEWDEQGLADALLDDNAVAQAPRPGTSLQRPGTSAASALSQIMGPLRPMTAAGRPVTGFARPGTSAATTSDGSVRAARPGTSRVMTALGRTIRLGTASILSSPGGPFIQPDKLDLRKYARRPALAKALQDYLLYVEQNPRKALELGAIATIEAGYGDWWWKERLGKCYFRLGLYRDAEKQFCSSTALQPMVATALQAARVTEKLDQPLAALNQLKAANDRFPGDTHILIAQARIHDAMGAAELAGVAYRKVLETDAISTEALACLASNAFYADQPEISLLYYRRLLQIGVDCAELWADLGIACFFAGQLDLCLPCFDRATQMAEDDTVGDVWYNISAVAVGLGDVTLAEQALQVALSCDANHAESHVNLGVLSMRGRRYEAARSHFTAAQLHGEHLYEAWYNGALLAYRTGDIQLAHSQCIRSLAIIPDHGESNDLLALIRDQLAQS